MLAGYETGYAGWLRRLVMLADYGDWLRQLVTETDYGDDKLKRRA